MEKVTASTVLGFYAANTLFMNFAPIIPVCTNEIIPGRVFWNCFYYCSIYGTVFMLGFIIHHLSKVKEVKHWMISLMIYAASFFIYYSFIINKSFPTYIAACNSKPAGLLFSLGIFTLILGVLVFLKEHTAIYVTVAVISFVFALILFSYILIPK